MLYSHGLNIFSFVIDDTASVNTCLIRRVVTTTALYWVALSLICFGWLHSSLLEDRLLRRRKQNIKGDDPATLSLDSDSTHNKQGYLSVSTRFLSSSPPLYWFASYVMVHPSSKSKMWGCLIWAYCAAYILLGSILFSNFVQATNSEQLREIEREELKSTQQSS
ncbi:hypothetical protein LguiA_007642 [Lonicera macranthoides]